MNGEFTEEKIQNKLYEYLCGYSDRVVITNWKGWTYKGDDAKVGHKTFFHREFDVATFEKQDGELVLKGYETKGYNKIKRKKKNGEQIVYEHPAFGGGLDQALVLLLEGADYSYLVIPEPERDVDKEHLKKLCDDFAAHIGLIFVTKDWTFWTYREAQRNYSNSRERKIEMLASALASGMMGRKRRFTMWARKHEF